MPVYKLGMEALQEDRKKLVREFEELKDHCAEIAVLRAAAPAPPLKWQWVDLDARPKPRDLDARPRPRYTMQV